MSTDAESPDPTSDAGARGLGTFRAGLALLLVAALLWTSRDVLPPPILFGVTWVALYPLRDREGVSALLLALGAVTALWVLATTGGLLAPFLVAMGLAYMLDPVVDRVEARGMGRTPAILALAVPALVLLALIAVFGVPALVRQAEALIRDLPTLVDRVQKWAVDFERWLETLPLIGPEIKERVQALDGDSLARMFEERRAAIVETSAQAVMGVGRGVGAALALLGYLVITPVLAFYLLRDWDGVVGRIDDLLPRDRRDAIVRFAGEYDHLLGKYVRGQLTVALATGTLTALLLWALSFPYAFLIGGFVTLFSVVPYLGLLLSIFPAVVVALTSGAVLLSLGKVALVFAIVQGLEGSVISPRIVGDSVGLHPVWVVLALSAGGYYLGFVGLLLAVPIAAGIKLLVVRLTERYRTSGIYAAGRVSEGAEGDV
jgi:predicted PurR-regulated permease PerM